MYAIVGITGNTGKITAGKLLAEGKPVRGLVRSAAKAAEWNGRGVETVVGSLSDTEALTKLFREVEGAYIMTPTYHDSQDMFADSRRDVAALKQAATAAGLPKLVLLSSIGAHLATGTGPILKLRELEQTFFALPIATASIRAAWFMENFIPLAASAKETGIFPSFLQPLDHAVSVIATRDIGDLAAKLLQESWAGQRIIELETVKRYSPNEVAAVIAAVLGREVTAEAVDRSAWLPTFQSWGLGRSPAEAMAEMIDGFNRDWITFEGGRAEHEVGGTPLEAVLRLAVNV